MSNFQVRLKKREGHRKASFNLDGIALTIINKLPGGKSILYRKPFSSGLSESENYNERFIKGLTILFRMAYTL